MVDQFVLAGEIDCEQSSIKLVSETRAIGTGKHVRPISALMKSFERGSTSTFRYVIVSPFALIQARMGEGGLQPRGRTRPGQSLTDLEKLA